MPYFDLHCHPGLKTLFQPQNGQQLSAWHNIGVRLLGNILSSQSSLKQISEASVPLICITLHPPEAGMINQFILKLGGAVLYPQIINLNRLSQMSSGASGYHQVFYEELANLLKPAVPGDEASPQKKIRFLKSWDDYHPGDADTTHVVFNIEGGHALYDDGDELHDPAAALNNLDEFLKLNFLTLYITPTHLTPNRYITHAYGNKILTKGPLLPAGLGITRAGFQLISHAYAKGLLVDVKHMSLVSRLVFYKIHQRLYPNTPILASHSGLTGTTCSGGTLLLSWSTDQHAVGGVIQLNGVKNRGRITGTSFYPLSINLFNEDIYNILQSGGMIGLSLDVRILGGKDSADTLQHDFLTPDEYSILSSSEDVRDAMVNAMAEALINGTESDHAQSPVTSVSETALFNHAIEDEMAEIFPIAETAVIPVEMRPNRMAHARLLANQLVHIKFVADIYGLPAPWKNICIGSDFDGLIEAVDCCKNVKEYGQLADSLNQALTDYATTPGIITRLEASPAQIVEWFCFTNAHEFLDRHFSKQTT